MKSTVNDLDITPPLKVSPPEKLSNLFSSFFHFLPPFYLLSFSNVFFPQFAYHPFTFSNSFPIYLDIPPQIFNHPTYTTILPYTSPAVPFFYILHPLLLVVLLLLLLVQTLQSILLYFLSFLSFPKYLPQP